MVAFFVRSDRPPVTKPNSCRCNRQRKQRQKIFAVTVPEFHPDAKHRNLDSNGNQDCDDGAGPPPPSSSPKRQGRRREHRDIAELERDEANVLGGIRGCGREALRCLDRLVIQGQCSYGLQRHNPQIANRRALHMLESPSPQCSACFWFAKSHPGLLLEGRHRSM